MLKKVAIALGVLLAIAGGTAIYLWNRVTALPDWYTQPNPSDRGDSIAEPGTDAPTPQWIALDDQGQPRPEQPPRPLQPSLEASEAPPVDPGATPAPPPRSHRPARRRSTAKRHELRGFHVRRDRHGRRHRSPAIKASRALYDDGHLELGVVLDLSRLPKDQLRPGDRARYERAIANFPGLTGRDVWVGVEDEPIGVGGYLQLSTDAEIRVGTLTYSLASAAERMGMGHAELRAQLNRELRRLGLTDPGA